LNKDRGISFSLSLLVHAVVFLLVFYLYSNIGSSLPAESKSVIEIEFENPPPKIGGDAGKKGGEEEPTPDELKEETEEKPVEKKPEKETVKPTDIKNKDKDGVKTTEQPTKQGKDEPGKSPDKGKGGGTSTGTGYSIGWGDKGKRAILNYNIPKYPPGVNVEGNVVLSFTILPNGSVGAIVPVKKLHPTLDNLSINSLSKWRFEKLPPGETFSQQATITFPYRLR